MPREAVCREAVDARARVPYTSLTPTHGRPAPGRVHALWIGSSDDPHLARQGLAMPLPADDQLSLETLRSPRSPEPRGSGVGAVWLTAGPVGEPIEALLLEMLKSAQPSRRLRETLIEEFGRPVKRLEVVLEYLGLALVGRDANGPCPLELVEPRHERDLWRDALLTPAGPCPLGLIVETSDQGRAILMHEVFGELDAAQQELIRRYAARALTGEPHARILEAMRRDGDEPEPTLAAARRRVQGLDPSVLFSADGAVRVQLGSLSRTTRDLLREGVQGEQLFILPANLFAGKTNYADIEFLVYLNFFARARVRTRIVGTAQQQRTLMRLLTLTVFGLFDPALEAQPTFEQLRRHYGVPDREAWGLFHASYETFAVRADPGPRSRILAIDDYVDFTVLTPAGAQLRVGPGSGSEVRMHPRGGGFEVRIASRDGRERSKHLRLPAPRRAGALASEALDRAVRFSTDRPRFGVTPLGTSHGFDPAGDLSSLVVWVNGKGILLDPSPEALAYLGELGVDAVDVPYVLLTHIHADHDGGLLEKLLSGRRTTILASDVVFRMFAEKTRLITGHDIAREAFVRHVAVDPGRPVTIEVAGEPVVLEARWNLHPIPTNGFTISVGGRRLGYSGDTKYDPELLGDLRDRGRLTADQFGRLMHFFWSPDGTPTVDLLFHEAGVPPIHTDRKALEALPDPVKARTHLVHIADADVPEGALPGKARTFETHVLLPATAEMRDRLLLETLRLVSYMYDTPRDVLDELARRADVLDWQVDDVIIRKGSVERGEPLHFFVIADGEVAVKDGRRSLARLVKGDSFGEWGISHQRGFRVADVVALRACRSLRFGEAEYWWLVERQPVVQTRISRIRSLLPRLSAAQHRARVQGDRLPADGQRLLASMTATQLSGLALFGEVQSFGRGESVLTEGAPADGFYVLLSGHLVATVGDRLIGELSEGDGFGEMGLLDGGRRGASVTVVSADAEALFMSARSFRGMLDTMPAFAWDVWETAARRREASPTSAGTEERL